MKPFKKIALSLLVASQLAIAADDNKVMLNFVNSDLESTVKAIGLITGKNFVLDARAKGTINIVSSTPVAKDLVYPVLLSALRMQGLTAVETEGVIKILPEADAKQNWGLTTDRKLNVSGDRIITQVLPLKHESAAGMVSILRPLITPNNTIAAYPNSNTLVITDYADNVRRLNRIIANIDQPSQSELISISLKYASALEVAQTMSRLMPEVTVAGGAPAPAMVGAEGIRKSVVVPDTRGNTLLIRSETSAHAQQIRKMVEMLDKPGAGGNIRVVYLKNADATRLAGTLKAILTGSEIPALPSGGSMAPAAPTPGGISPPIPSAPASSGGGTGGGTISPGVAIQAEPTTNSLIITAPDNVYNNLRAVIDKLDARRAQVYVEAMIAEVNVGKVGEFGVQWLVAGSNGTISGLGSSSLGNFGADSSRDIQTVAGSLANLAAGKAGGAPLPGGFTFGLLNGVLGKDSSRIPNLGALATALQNNGAANILSTPNLVTLDNEEAKIVIGQNVPFVTGTQASTGSNPNPFTTVERKDIGITLKVKPQVSEGGAITMQVYQEVSSVDTGLSTGGAGLATKKRSIESKVLVDDGQVLVLGGLIEDQQEQGKNEVPLLGEIPLLGNLFKYEKRSTKKTNLMVFLRPIILRDSQSAQTLSNDRYQSLRQVEGGYSNEKHLFLPDIAPAKLPELPPAKPADTKPAAMKEAPSDGARLADGASNQ